MKSTHVVGVAFAVGLALPAPVAAGPRRDTAQPQTAEQQPAPDRGASGATEGLFGLDWYISLGFNRAFFSRSDIHVRQPALGNVFTVHDVSAHDEVPSFTQPDNVRLGAFCGDAKQFGVELSLDHTKYTSTRDQLAWVSGQNSGGVGKQTLTAHYFSYKLHNGINLFTLNAVFRQPIFGELGETNSLAFLGRLGVGPAIVHPQIVVNGGASDVGSKDFLHNLVGYESGWWRVVGASVGLEAGLRYVFFRPLFLELTDKEAFITMRRIPVFQGKAAHNVWQNELVLTLGCSF